MKVLLLLLLFPIATVSSQCIPGRGAGLDENRFAITKNGRKGFINMHGEVVIQPQFQAAIGFSEGLCAVRIDGRYGFISTQGELCIPARYDYATIFREGLALVYLDGKPLFINASGTVAFTSDYKQMIAFKDGRAYVQTNSEKWGILDRQGKLLVDTIYGHIGQFDHGFAIVHGPDHQEYESEDKKQNLQVSVIDASGKMLFPYGKFKSIDDYNEGYFKVDFPERKGNVSVDAIVNIQGEIVFALPENQKSWINGNVHDGIIQVSLPLNKRSEDYYGAYLTLNGRMVYDNKRVYSCTDFKENVAFVSGDDFKYSLINRQGKLVSKEKFSIPGFSFENPFENGMAVVKFSDGAWGVIDTTARVVLKTGYTEFFSQSLIESKYLFYEGKANDSLNAGYGLINLEGKVLIPPILQDFDARGFVDGLLKTKVDNKITYFNRDGRQIWQDPDEDLHGLAPLNIDFMNRGYFYVNVDDDGRQEEYRIEPELTEKIAFAKGVLSVMASQDQDLVFMKMAKGMRVDIANATSDTLIFNAQDNRLYVKMQARDKDGNWQDIEYLPSSWCGNSYHSLQLPPGQYWAFVAPVYEGTLTTAMRIAVSYIDPSDKPDREERRRQGAYSRRRELILYSNEFSGSINPAQFWRRPEYSPSGIMDPYNE